MSWFVGVFASGTTTVLSDLEVAAWFSTCAMCKMRPERISGS